MSHLTCSDPPGQAPRSLLDFRLVIVTGKGGVGKTAISCQLAESARLAGKRVLLAETAAIESIAANFEVSPRPLGYRGRELRPGLHALRIDPHEALADYARIQIGLGLVTDRVLKLDVFQQLLEAAPGWRELIILGKIWHLEQKKTASGQPLYDILVVDAPATGHGLSFLDVPRVVQQAVRAGPLARHASWVEALVHDRERTIMLPVTLPEELPVLETRELVERAQRDIQIGVDRIVVNRMPSHRAETAFRHLRELPAELALESLPSVPAMQSIFEHLAKRDHAAFAQRDLVSEICNLPILELPILPGGFGAKTDWASHPEKILQAATWPNGDKQESKMPATVEASP